MEKKMDKNSHIPLGVRTRDGVAFADVESKPGGRAPDFCIVGAAKCATTSINAMLAHHPHLFMNPLKEPHYYSTEIFYQHKRDWYFGLYADAKPEQLLGEASTSYARYPAVKDVPERMAADNPDMKIILNVREPVARLKSECLQEIKYRTYTIGEQVDVISLDRYLEETEAAPSERTGKIEAGEYMKQLERFLACFPRENILVMFYSDFSNDPKNFLRDITDFIGVAPLSDMEFERKNRTEGIIEGIIAQNSIDRIDRIPFARTLRKALPHSLRQTMRRVVTRKQAAKYEFSSKRNAELKAHYAPHNDLLREFSGRALKTWS